MGQQLSGARIEDHYYLQKVKLGQGSFGTVWRAVNRQTNDVVAVKQMDKASMPKRGVKRQDIEREITVMQALKHENITQLHDFFEDQAAIYLALEYCDGGDFGDKVKERGMGLKEQEASDWMHMVISALACLHGQAICHRDIKPDNFMIHRNVVKLSDFGLALFLPKGRLLTDQCGTPAFMSPEQHRLPRHSRGYDHACDVWAAGVTMYMLMLGGKHPFLGNGGDLNIKRLMSGTLEFNAGQGFLGLFASDKFYTEGARKFCHRLVEPNVSKRHTAETAQQDPWLQQSSLAHRRTGETPRVAAAVPSPKPETAALQYATPVGLGRLTMQRVEPANPSPPPAPQAPSIDDAHCPRPQGRWWHRAGAENLPPNPQFAVPTKSPHIVPEGSREPNEKPHGLTQAITIDPADASHLRRGTKCRYYSNSYGAWMPAVVQCYNESDGTYDLDVRQHAKTENVSPDPHVAPPDAWPPGTPVFYESTTARNWLPATVVTFNEGAPECEGTYDLDIRIRAEGSRMRPR